MPFPTPTPAQTATIRDLAEQLDSLRKVRQAEYPKLTMTGMYNVLQKLRTGEPLTAKEKTSHEQGLVSVLKQLHDDLDAAVFTAYGWPADLTDAKILENLVALNAVRAAAESQGQILWLRPEFQNPGGAAGQTVLDVAGPGARGQKRGSGPSKLPWPKSLPDQVRAVREALSEAGQPVTALTVARRFARARADKVVPILETLVAVGQARVTAEGMFVGGR